MLSWRAHATRRPARTDLIFRVIAGLLPLALIFAACTAANDPGRARWVGGSGRGGGAGAPSGARPSTGARPGPTARTGEPGGRTGKDGYLTRIPTFPRRPAAQPIKIPGGPNADWLSRIPTNQPVAFITIDDGWVQQPEAVGLLAAAHVPVTLFLTIDAIRNNPGYFRQLQSVGAVIEAHTLTHTELKGRSYEFQRHEICGSADQLGALYQRRPVLFRPPFGDKDVTTLRASRDCGMPAAFFWTETVDHGVVRFQQGNRVKPGDIILMHFRPAFVDDFIAALQAIHAAGLTPALLEDYLTEARADRASPDRPA